MQKTKTKYLTLLAFIPILVVGLILGMHAWGATPVCADAQSSESETITIFFYNSLELTGLRVYVVGESTDGMVMLREAPSSNWYFADIDDKQENEILVVFFGNNARGARVEINGVVSEGGGLYFSNAGRFSNRVNAQTASHITGGSGVNTALIVLAIVLIILGLVAIAGATVFFVAKQKKQA